MILAIAIFNLLIATIRLYQTLKQRRLISIAWFLIAYFSAFFLPVSMETELLHFRGFTAETISIKHSSIDRTLIFVLAFNLLFLLGESMASAILRGRGMSGNQVWSVSASEPYYKKLELCFAVVLAIGAIMYGLATREHSYQDFVEYKGSNWGQVFLMAGAPLATIAALRRKYLIAILACIPFVYFAVRLHIRSFALLSIVPVLVIYGLQYLAGKRIASILLSWRGIGASFLILVLIGVSIAILSEKRDQSISEVQVLPDSGMPYGATVMMALIDKYEVTTGVDALLLQGSYLITPFRKLLGLPAPNIEDPPIVMARLYEGMPENWHEFYHYPTLWYADAYIAFGYWGVSLALLWGILFVVIEKGLSRSLLLFGLMIPYFSWYIYMIIRGAIAGAAVPFSYAAYVVIIVAFLAGYNKFFRYIFRPNKRSAKNISVNAQEYKPK